MRDAGEVLLLPGLVNAHTHLELTALAGRLKRAPFPVWAAELGAVRAGWGAAEVERSLREGIRQSIAAGTTAVGDFAYLSRVDALRQSRLRAVSWREALGIAPERAAEAERRARGFSARATPLWRGGFAPHAPYSCSAELYRRLARAARIRREPFATHAAELREEIEFLATGGGAFSELLRAIGRDRGSWRPPRQRPLAWLASIGVLRGATVAHANYAGRAGIGLLRRHRATVVWCPRTHAFFGHPPHPVRRMRAAGVPVAIGTDSLGSAPSLSVLDEIRFAEARGHRPGELLEMATAAGGVALGVRAGRIARGWAADFTVVEGRGPEDLLGGRVVGRAVAGVFDAARDSGGGAAAGPAGG